MGFLFFVAVFVAVLVAAFGVAFAAGLATGFGMKADIQKSVPCLAVSFINVEAWRLASAVARARAVLAMVFAPLNHMLINVFFLSQGFFMGMLR